MWLAGRFGLTPDCAAVWASAGNARPKHAAKAATVSSISIRFIRSSSFCAPAHQSLTAAAHLKRDPRRPEPCAARRSRGAPRRCRRRHRLLLGRRRHGSGHRGGDERSPVRRTKKQVLPLLLRLAPRATDPVCGVAVSDAVNSPHSALSPVLATPDFYVMIRHSELISAISASGRLGGSRMPRLHISSTTMPKRRGSCIHWLIRETSWRRIGSRQYTAGAAMACRWSPRRPPYGIARSQTKGTPWRTLISA
jgi:hypothetical protein